MNRLKKDTMRFSRAEFSSIPLAFLLNTLFISRMPMAPFHILHVLYRHDRATTSVPLEKGIGNSHLSCVHQILPWCFSYDAVNYARYMSAYYSDKTSLPDEHPEVHEFMRNGGFSVLLSNDNTFGRIPVDQSLEETINKDTRTPGGTQGL